MHKFYDEFVSYLYNEDKDRCIQFVKDKLERGDLDIVELYLEILTPSLNNMECKDEDRDVCIWKEHVRSSIVRTVIECCYPYVTEKRRRKRGEKSKGRAIVVCPTEEYHEIGARMVADFFTLCGFDVMFVGANTPIDDILGGIKVFKPRYVAISVSSSYNLVATKRVIARILDLREKVGKMFKVIVGGNAFENNPEMHKEIGADYLFQSYEDIEKLTGGGT